jgi:hypothetical protein
MAMENRCYGSDGKTKNTLEKPASVALCLQIIPYGMSWDRTRAS